MPEKLLEMPKEIIRVVTQQTLTKIQINDFLKSKDSENEKND